MSDILCVHYYALIPFCDSALPFTDQLHLISRDPTLGLRGVLQSLPYLPDKWLAVTTFGQEIHADLVGRELRRVIDGENVTITNLEAEFVPRG
ncbi:hypothetical protein CK203_081989 [Vitis vinifera]|uniref:Uncharacterized protein n=1 Tax=Vitis vinifera TaxID=29760 RepID=A0A438BWJ6_VITVI|nr:hypothetical protein CK203_081989 [Vitis vinifera]